MRSFNKSSKLDNVCYDIRGPALEEATRMEEAGLMILKLNIGNPAAFGFRAPEEIIKEISDNLTRAEGYIDSKGLVSAREAIASYSMRRGITNLIAENIYIGNGVSELIVMAMQGLLDNGDEILLPAPDYPLWTAAVVLAGGRPVHYICDESSNWYPDTADIRKKISSRTKGIVVINPNNPTGAVYPIEVLRNIADLASEHNLALFSDEIYDRILYEGVVHVPTASAANRDTLCVTLNGLSKSHLITGYRVGWMAFSGDISMAKNYLEGVNMLASMRLCSNVPAQYAIAPALRNNGAIRDHTSANGRLRRQRDLAYEWLLRIPGLSCTKPQGAFYFFPRLDLEKFKITNDEKFVLDLLKRHNVLVVHGTAFNWIRPDHFRIIFLPETPVLQRALGALEYFLRTYRQS